MNQLVFVDWYTNTALYRDGKLVYYGHGHFSLAPFEALGFQCSCLPDVPTTFYSSVSIIDKNGRLQKVKEGMTEYDVDEGGNWKPPALLVTLERQQAAVQERERRERILELREELMRLCR